jgi:uncharacterized BrkB/YihY/UPF0761 family membrane protein
MTLGLERKPAGGWQRGEGLGWALAGAVILVGSIGMDRLAEQGVQPYAAPGLLPGMLSALMIVSGIVLAFRRAGDPCHNAAERPRSARTWIVISLCLVFSFGLIGHGLPFWLAAAIFVAVSILVLNPGRDRRWPSLARTGFAATVGLAAGVAATLIFQEIFLVRLP